MYETIKKMIAEELGIAESKITPESNFITDLNADSLDLVQMLMAMENKFGLTFVDDEINSIKTVGDIVGFIESRKNA